jgi:hypothetical protein
MPSSLTSTGAARPTSAKGIDLVDPDRPFCAARPPFGTAWHKSLDPLPLIIPKSVAIHRRSPKISVESDLPSLGNPKSLNRHRALEGFQTNPQARIHPLFFPKAKQGCLVVPHNDPGIGAPDQRAAIAPVAFGKIHACAPERCELALRN